MDDRDCVLLLEEALPRLGLRWQGFRKVRSQVCRRIAARIRELGLPGAAEYRVQLENDPGEWSVLDSCCRITISRFRRDQEVFTTLALAVLPELAANALSRGDRTVACWSAGCASGEEPFTLTILWHLDLQQRFPDIRIAVTASDADEAMLERAREGRYRPSSLRELPASWRTAAFHAVPDGFQLREEYQEAVRFVHHDLRTAPPAGAFDLVLCRNLAFTYFDDVVQRAVLGSIEGAMVRNGALVIGIHESLPLGAAGFEPWVKKAGIYRKT
jgi:chemotaxis protein methyltransferase CheR